MRATRTNRSHEVPTALPSSMLSAPTIMNIDSGFRRRSTAPLSFQKASFAQYVAYRRRRNPPIAVLGSSDNNDRVYTELRYTF